MSIWTTLRTPYFPHTYKQTKTGRFVRSLCAVSRSLATLFSFFINLTCFIWFRNDSTKKSFGKTFSWKTFDSSYHCTQKKTFLLRFIDKKNGWRKFRCAFILLPLFIFSRQTRDICTYLVFCLENQVSNFWTHDETDLNAIDH